MEGKGITICKEQIYDGYLLSQQKFRKITSISQIVRKEGLFTLIPESTFVVSWLQSNILLQTKYNRSCRFCEAIYNTGLFLDRLYSTPGIVYYEPV